MLPRRRLITFGKWEQTGKPDFNMIFNFAEEVDGRVVREFLRLWVY